MPTIKFVYQDCPMCGSRKNWGEKQLALAKGHGIEVQTLSFASPEGSHLCKEALLAGITRLPFFTNGLIFRESIDDFIPVEEPKPKKKTTKRKTKKSEA